MRRYYYDSYNRLSANLAGFLDDNKFAKWLKTLEGLIPYE